MRDLTRCSAGNSSRALIQMNVCLMEVVVCSIFTLAGSRGSRLLVAFFWSPWACTISPAASSSAHNLFEQRFTYTSMSAPFWLRSQSKNTQWPHLLLYPRLPNAVAVQHNAVYITVGSYLTTNHPILLTMEKFGRTKCL